MSRRIFETERPIVTPSVSLALDELISPESRIGKKISTRKRAESGDPLAQFELGWRFFEGEGYPKDYAQAYAWFDKSAQAGHLGAKTFLAGMLLDGLGVETDIERAASIYREAAEKGDTYAKINLARMLRFGQAAAYYPDEEYDLLMSAAKSGNGDAAHELSVFLKRLNQKDPRHKAYRDWLKVGVDLGVPESEFVWAVERLAAQESQDEVMQSLKMLHRLADQSHIGAILQLGRMYQHGEGVERDESRALNLYSTATALGDGIAANNLANCYYFGYGTKPDRQMWLKYLILAAERMSERAIHNIGYCYLGNNQFKPEPYIASRWFSFNIARNHAPSISNLGVMYTGDFGLEQDLPFGLALLRRALELGHEDIKQYYQEKLSAGSLAEGDLLEIEIESNIYYNEYMDLLKKFKDDAASTLDSPGANTEDQDLEILSTGKLVRTNFQLLEGAREYLKAAAGEQKMSLTEFLRRAAFAAASDPSILRRDVADRAEETYSQGLGESRWKKDFE